MIDFARITVRAGDGGNGAGSFRQIRGKRYGKADGGDGGRGGDVYCQATSDLNTLEKYRYVKDFRAGNGGNGLSNHRRGARGEDLTLLVPVGTVVRVITDYGLQTTAVDSRQLTVDLVDDNQRVLVARGGEGGRGNAHLRDEYGARPKVGEKGQEGEQVNLTLELKLLADVGLIGLPNSGKSTLLAKLTAAKPKIASYPFTTLEPNLGVMSAFSNQRLASSEENLNANSLISRRLILADIPGLIEGASGGKGLGDLFLRHIERTKVLVHLVDVSKVSNVPKVKESLFSKDRKAKGKNSYNTSETFETFETFDTSSLWQDYQTIRDELKAYSGELAKKKEIIVLTKSDLVDEGRILGAKKMFSSHRKKALVISAATGEGLKELVKEIQKVVKSRSHLAAQLAVQGETWRGV